MASLVEFHETIKKLRKFFEDEKGFIEVHPQSRLSILAACEDPTTVSTFSYGGKVWPLPQTGQMWLEHDLLKNPDCSGLFCVSTSYRNEPNPIPGRHDLIFPMFEFEMHGGVTELYQMERELLEYLGFGDRYCFPSGKYEEVAKKYNVKELGAEEEIRLWVDVGPVYFLQNFPKYTSPFWNMKMNKNIANKIDVILFGMETIGSAERSTDVDIMRENFYSISNGMYANMLFSHFGKERVEKELEEFFSLDFFPRSGGGIGVTRMIRAMKLLKDGNPFFSSGELTSVIK